MSYETLKKKAKKIATKNGHDVKGFHFTEITNTLDALKCCKCGKYIFIDSARVFPEICGRAITEKCGEDK